MIDPRTAARNVGSSMYMRHMGFPYLTNAAAPYAHLCGTESPYAAMFSENPYATMFPYGELPWLDPYTGLVYMDLYQAIWSAAAVAPYGADSNWLSAAMQGWPAAGVSGISQTDCSPAASRCAMPLPVAPAQRPQVDRPLRVIHVGQHLVRAGIEMWLKALVKFSDSNLLRFQRCVVTGPYNDPQVIREMPVPVEIGGRESVRQAARDCDVLLVSGPAELASWLEDVRPPTCVFVAHGDGAWTRQILDRCSSVIDHVAAVSYRARDEVCNGFPTTVIYNGVDAQHLTRSANRDAFRSQFGFGPDDIVLGSVMRLSVEKRPELLIEAIAQLPRRFKLFLVGWGPLQHKLLDLANRIAPMRCVLAPATCNLGDFYGAFDAFCLPSVSEGFGLATLEAMLCGVPVITTRTGFAPELLIDRVHYVQCEPSAAAISSSLQMLAQQPQWAAGLAAEGQRVAEQFGYAGRMCREYEDLLIRLWQGRQPERA